MILSVIGTGSSGNTYILDADGEVLILDCGYSLKEVKKKLNFDLSKIVGVYVTHIHEDHSKYRKEYEMAGIPIFAPYDRKNEREKITFGGFELYAFQVPHGETPNYGLLIQHGKEKAIYITDFSYCRWNFKNLGINHFIVEVNYQEEYVDLESVNFKHKIADHASLRVAKEFLKANETWHMQNVILVHMGFNSCNPSECVKEIEDALDVGVKVDYARPNITYELSNQRLPFTEGD